MNENPSSYPRRAALVSSVEMFHIIRHFGRPRLLQHLYHLRKIARAQQEPMIIDNRNASDCPEAPQSFDNSDGGSPFYSQNRFIKGIDSRLDEHNGLAQDNSQIG